MSTNRPECEQFPAGSRQRAICEGCADMPPSKVNGYRAKWHLPPLPDEEIKWEHSAKLPPRQPVSHKEPPPRNRKVTVQRQPTSTTKRKGGCQGCRDRKKMLNRIMPGVGDLVEKVTKATGIKKWVDGHADDARSQVVARLLSETEVVVKSFMRQDSLQRFVQSVRQQYPALPIRIADDSPLLTPAGKQVQATAAVAWHQMPYDSGLPAGRNLCVRNSTAKYVVVCDDDFLFTAETDVAALLLPLHYADVDICGGLVRMDGRTAQNWCGRLAIEKHGETTRIAMRHDSPTPEEIEGVTIFRSDVTYNFFAAKRDVLVRYPWDERYKITSEHLDSFLTWKNAGVQVAYTPNCICSHVRGGGSQYKSMRRRNQQGMLRKKWGVTTNKTIAVTKFPGI